MAHARRLLEEMRNRDSAGPGGCQPQSQSLELVITGTGDVCDATSETANDDKDEFRTLADSIMEEFAITSDEDDGDDGDEQAEAPTFTFPGKEQDASSATILEGTGDDDTDNPWKNIAYLLAAGNTRMINILTQVGITPDFDALSSFYYSAFDDSSPQHYIWLRLNALETIMDDDSFSSECLHSELLSSTTASS